MTSTVLLKRGKSDGIIVYIPKETILKEVAAKIKLSQHFFSNLVRELSDTPHIYFEAFTVKVVVVVEVEEVEDT
jgi:hypothetical protein